MQGEGMAAYRVLEAQRFRAYVWTTIIVAWLMVMLIKLAILEII